MNILFQFGHPAHFYLFRHVIANLQRDGYQTYILIKKKDILEELLKKSGMSYVNILPSGKKSAFSLILRLWRVFRFALGHRVDVLVGSTPEVAQIGWLLRRRSVILAEDDAAIVPRFIRAVRPFVDQYLSPVSCDNGILEPRTTHYEGFQKLAYLHPNQFSADPGVVDRYFPHQEPYFILRFARLNAYHDVDVHARGINQETARRLIDILEPYGRVFISSERALESEFEPYRLDINPLDIHHLMAFSRLYIGDSQSMAVEAAVLGTPGIRFNDFAGKIGVLEELENRYGLTCAIPTSAPERLFDQVKAYLAMPDLHEVFQKRRKIMLSEKIDVTCFITEFIENLPKKG